MSNTMKNLKKRMKAPHDLKEAVKKGERLERTYYGETPKAGAHRFAVAFAGYACMAMLLLGGVIVLPAMLNGQAPVAQSDPAVTSIPDQLPDLLKDFVPEEKFTSALQKWADTENYTILYHHQFRWDDEVGENHTWMDLYFTETRDGTNVHYNNLNSFHPLDLDNHRLLDLVYLDGLLYVEKGEEKTKLTIAEEEILPYLNDTLPDFFVDVKDLLEYMTVERTNAIEPLSDRILSTATAVQEGDTVVVTFQLNQEEAAATANWNMLNCNEIVPGSIRVLRGTYTVTFDQYGVITKTRTDVEVTFETTFGQTYYGYDTVEYSLTYGDAKVEAPENPESYTEVTEQPENN